MNIRSASEVRTEGALARVLVASKSKQHHAVWLLKDDLEGRSARRLRRGASPILCSTLDQICPTVLSLLCRGLSPPAS